MKKNYVPKYMLEPTRKIDWRRYEMQEGIIPIPIDHPDRPYIEREKERIDKLTQALKDERAFMVGQKAKAEWIESLPIIERIEEFRKLKEDSIKWFNQQNRLIPREISQSWLNSGATTRMQKVIDRLEYLYGGLDEKPANT